MRQKRYSSDLTDSQWEQIKSYFATGRRRKYHLRYHVLDAILYIVKTGTQWRMLPCGFAPWQTAYYYFRRWREEGRIRCILSITCRSARRRAGRHGEPSALIVDCQSVPSARTGGISSFDAFKKVKGRKRHIAVDMQGLLWGIVVHAAGDHETQWALQLLAPVASRLSRVETVFADQAYRGLEETIDRELDWKLQVVESDDEPGFSVDPKRWIVERTYGWFGGWRRLDREYERRIDSSETMVRFAMLRIVLNRLN
ncbi:putative transposase [Salinibacter ruber]|uniref:IS5 family transposase n=1 Tax=Salinibacter ruber TaxID=146919 RepID=UPI0021685683|nr:IS5 family transposase [Salinibacter ruber]MCS3855293.1 putative transposase [Salinibacter ruber]